jgi:hypothetical protein
VREALRSDRGGSRSSSVDVRSSSPSALSTSDGGRAADTPGRRGARFEVAGRVDRAVVRAAFPPRQPVTDRVEGLGPRTVARRAFGRCRAIRTSIAARIDGPRSTHRGVVKRAPIVAAYHETIVTLKGVHVINEHSSPHPRGQVVPVQVKLDTDCVEVPVIRSASNELPLMVRCKVAHHVARRRSGGRFHELPDHKTS